jgi:hypothetical protein
LVGVRVLWASRPTWSAAVGGVQSVLDDVVAVEGRPDRGRRNRGWKMR